jgi:predicted cupin superfamily sugar epimerase
MLTPQEIIKMLNLSEHPLEGGYFVETYRSKEQIKSGSVPNKRSLGTAIYYLLTADTFSEMHQLCIDEIFHFYLGDPVEMLQLFPDGTGKRIILGHDLASGMLPQVLIPAGIWQGSRLIPGGKFALMGTTVSPGFEFSDYLAGSRIKLINQYPDYREIIIGLTRD